MLSITNLHVQPAPNNQSSSTQSPSPIISGLNLSLQASQVHVLMGPNGSGKSTLAQTLMGNPHYQVTKGKITFRRRNLLKTSPDLRSRLGIFLSFQQPIAIPGVSPFQLLKSAHQHHHPDDSLSALKFKRLLETQAQHLRLNPQFLTQPLNLDLSGGEKKKMELLQLLILQPRLIILDEIDTGLDVDALKLVATTIKKLLKNQTPPAILIITHYHRLLKYLTPTHVHIIKAGRIIKSAGPALAKQIEKSGYQHLN
jgi:Fe-S cluster assembly ATP-binding protein